MKYNSSNSLCKEERIDYFFNDENNTFIKSNSLISNGPNPPLKYLFNIIEHIVLDYIYQVYEANVETDRYAKL